MPTVEEIVKLIDEGGVSRRALREIGIGVEIIHQVERQLAPMKATMAAIEQAVKPAHEWITFLEAQRAKEEKEAL